jgi:hypothetical protein
VIVLIFAVLLGVALSQPGGGTWNASTCQFTYQGKVYDLATLMLPTGYYWKEMLYLTNAANLQSNTAPATVTMNFELNICANVKSQFPSCTMPSPINMITADGKNCTALGDLRTMSMDLTPFQDGVMVEYWHGEWMDNIHSYATTVYITCGSSFAAPFVEHLKSGFNMYHISIRSPLVC